MHTLSLSLALYIYIWLLWQKCSRGCCKWSITCVTDFLTLPLCFSNSEGEVWVWWALKVVGRLRKARENCSSSQKVLCRLEAFAFPVCRWACRCMAALLPSRTGFPKALRTPEHGLWPLVPAETFSWQPPGAEETSAQALHGQGCQELHRKSAL